jgi:PhzF family phenazine biosynthesis protein
VLSSAEEVSKLAPDMNQVAEIKARGVIVTARSDVPDFDFVSRFFAPATGVPEDPVTGSAHCCLGPYWGGVLGKAELVGRQVSKRGGTVTMRVGGDRVILSGSAVLVVEGKLNG